MADVGCFFFSDEKEVVKGKYRCFTLLLMLFSLILFVALHLPAFAVASELESSCTCLTPQIFTLAN